MRERPDLNLIPTLGLKVGTHRTDRAEPDGMLAPVHHFLGQGHWADAEGVLMTVEITFYDADTHARDRVEKPAAYAEANIPCTCWWTVPDPVGIELDTEQLKRYVR
ncbi:hypothetical protein [Streptomyces sp. NPDC046939]|uniref:hypothetical protein n=1 Tax=Streptomyces sp. NPDC046939 TaxID=3155376 RepID=UPI0033E6FCF0